MPFSKSLIFEKSMRTKREIFWWYSLSSIKLSLYELFIKLVSNFQVNFSLKIMASPTPGSYLTCWVWMVLKIGSRCHVQCGQYFLNTGSFQLLLLTFQSPMTLQREAFISSPSSLTSPPMRNKGRLSCRWWSTRETFFLTWLRRIYLSAELVICIVQKVKI